MTSRPGTAIKIDGQQRYNCAEVLFNPAVGGNYDAVGIGHSVWDAITRSPMDARKDMMGCIMLIGGSAKIPGFKERLEHDVREKVTHKSVNSHL